MSLDIENIKYFDYISNNNQIIFTPKQFIKDIIYENGNTLVPFTNGKYYYVYQDITFEIIKNLEKDYSHISMQIIDIYEKNKLPKIVAINIQKHEFDIILAKINFILTKYINKRFSLWN